MHHHTWVSVVCWDWLRPYWRCCILGRKVWSMPCNKLKLKDGRTQKTKTHPMQYQAFLTSHVSVLPSYSSLTMEHFWSPVRDDSVTPPRKGLRLTSLYKTQSPCNLPQIVFWLLFASVDSLPTNMSTWLIPLVTSSCDLSTWLILAIVAHGRTSF